MEIEKKYIPKSLPKDLNAYQSCKMEQAYLNTSPVVRVRKENDAYVLTYKGGGMMAREEYNLPLNKKSYHHLLTKADGNIISKTRYYIPIHDNLTAELDIFEGTVEKRCAIYEIADDEDEENRAAAECNAAKNKLILAIEQLVEAHDQLVLQQKTKL